MTAKRIQRGLTLIELLTVLAISAVLLSVSVPSLGRLLAESEVRARSSALSVALASARMRAVETSRPVTLCPLDEGGSCHPGANWSEGWQVFDDPQRQGRPLEHDAIRQVESFGGIDVLVTSTAGRPVVTFRGDGSSVGSNLTLTICHRNHAGIGRQVIVNNVGRTRTGPLPRNWTCAP